MDLPHIPPHSPHKAENLDYQACLITGTPSPEPGCLQPLPLTRSEAQPSMLTQYLGSCALLRIHLFRKLAVEGG
jgi:hypothetical protein